MKTEDKAISRHNAWIRAARNIKDSHVGETCHGRRRPGGEPQSEKRRATGSAGDVAPSMPDSKVLTSGVMDGKLTIQDDGPAKIRVIAGTNIIGVHKNSKVASGHVMTVQFLGFVAVETIGKEPATFDFEVIERK